MRDWSVLGGVKVAPLLWLVKLGADRHRWLVPAETAHHVSATTPVLAPTGGEVIRADVEPVAPLRDSSKAPQGDGLEGPGEMELFTRVRPSATWQFDLRDATRNPVENLANCRRRVGRCRLRKVERRQVHAPADDDSALASLGRAIVRGVDDVEVELV